MAKILAIYLSRNPLTGIRGKMDQEFTRTAGNTAASNRGFEVSVIGGMEVTGSGPAERHRRFQKQPRSTMARRRSLDSLQDATIECLGTEPSPSIAIADIRLARFQNQRDRGAKLTACLGNLLELGPKGTGKSHIYAEFSPHGMLIRIGGDRSQAFRQQRQRKDRPRGVLGLRVLRRVRRQGQEGGQSAG